MKQDLTERNKGAENFHRTKMQKEMVIQKLRKKGCRITKQRQMLLEVILREECTCCKEIYYKAASIDASIGTATVYRMVNLLEEIGAINRKNMYKISCCINCDKEDVCVIELEDHSIFRLSAQSWHQVISEGLRACGYVKEQNVIRVLVDPCMESEETEMSQAQKLKHSENKRKQ